MYFTMNHMNHYVLFIHKSIHAEPYFQRENKIYIDKKIKNTDFTPKTEFQSNTPLITKLHFL